MVEFVITGVTLLVAVVGGTLAILGRRKRSSPLFWGGVTVAIIAIVPLVIEVFVLVECYTGLGCI